MRTLFNRLLHLLRRSRHDADLREEMETHRSLRQEKLEREGVVPADAEHASRRAFGNVMLAREDAREVWLGPAIEGVWQDVRFAVRSLVKRPVMAVTAILTLALALGANLAIFSLIDRVLLRPLDVPEADGLVTVQYTTQVRGVSTPHSNLLWFPASRILDMPAFERVAAESGSTERTHTRLSVVMDDGDQAVTADGKFVTANYFGVLGLVPAMGRDFSGDDDTASAAPVVMLSHRLWLARFGGDEAAIGRTLRVNGTPAVIIGVAPRSFTGTVLGSTPPDLYLPLRTAPRLATNTGAQSDGRGGGFFSVGPATAGSGFVPSAISPISSVTIIGRLDAAMREQAQAEVAAIVGRDDTTLVPFVEAMLPFESRSDLRQFLGLLAAAVGLTLLVGCANLTGLLLARTEERRAELAIRSALGAGRLRLVREAAALAGLLAAVGGAAAVGVAHGIDRVLVAFVLPGNIAISALRSGTDHRFLFVALGLTMVAAVVVGLAPAVRVSNARLALDLKRQRSLLPPLGATPVLVAVQVAVSVVFVFAALLFVRSLSNALATDVGFDRGNLIAASVTVPPGRMLDNATSDALIERVRRVPGVISAVVGPLPLVKPNEVSWRELTVDGIPVDLPMPIDVVYASADFFSSLRQPVVAGRDFDERDREAAAPVAIVNEAAARRFWPDSNVIGRRVGWPPPSAMRARGATTPEFSVVGVVGDVKLRSLRDAGEPVIYLARAQHQYYLAGVASAGGGALLVRVSGAVDRAARALPPAVAEVGLALQSVRPLDRAIDDLLVLQRVGRTLLMWLGALALALTAAGIYGLVSCFVVRSTKEIGVRLALGAGSRDIVRALSNKAMAPVVVGAAVGSAVAWSGGRYVDRFMYGIDGTDPSTLAVAVVVIVVSAIAASALPTWRALRINPVETLRAD